MKQRHFRLSGLAAAALLAVSAAHADNLSVNNSNHVYVTGDGKLATSLAVSTSGVHTPTLFDVQNLSTGSSFLAYCIEQSQGAVSASQSYTSSAYTSASGVQELYDRFYDTSLQTQQGAIAFQLALWQLTGGSTVASFSYVQVAGAKDLASSWISTVNADNNPFAQKYTLTRWSNVDHQDVLQAVAVPVPEPETYALMLAGLGAVGLIARRRQASR